MLISACLSDLSLCSSGDGRICIEAAKRGMNATGYELNPLLCLYSMVEGARQGVFSARFRCRNFWDVDLQSADVIIFFGIPEIMPRSAIGCSAQLSVACSHRCLILQLAGEDAG